MSTLENIIAEIVETFSQPQDCMVVKIREDGTEDLVAADLNWENAIQVAETVIPHLKRGDRISIRERSQFEF